MPFPRVMTLQIALALSGLFLSAAPPPAPSGRAPRVSVAAWPPGAAAHPKFTVTVGGKPARILRQLGPGSDEVILLALDLTGDVALVDPARQALLAGIAKLPPNTWVGVLRAQDGLHALVDPAADRKPVIDAIEALSASGKAGLLDTVADAVALGDALARKAAVRAAVLYVTDSDIANYRDDYTNPVINASDPHDLSRRFPEALVEEKIQKLKAELATRETPLFIVHLNYRRGRLNVAYQDGLKALAESAGGTSAICRSIPEIAEAIQATFRRMAAEWMLTVSVPPRARAGAPLKIEASGGADEGRVESRSRLPQSAK